MGRTLLTQLSCCAEENAEEKVWKLREEVKEKDMQNEELRRTNKQLEHQISTLEGEDPFVVWLCNLGVLHATSPRNSSNNLFRNVGGSFVLHI